MVTLVGLPLGIAAPDRLDRGDHMAFMPEDVLSKHLTSTQFRRGYDEREVDEFLDESVVELRRLNSDNNDLRARLNACQQDKGVILRQVQEKMTAARFSPERAAKDAAALLG
jgi:DivIVA domain-containing protein